MGGEEIAYLFAACGSGEAPLQASSCGWLVPAWRSLCSMPRSKSSEALCFAPSLEFLDRCGYNSIRLWVAIA